MSFQYENENIQNDETMERSGREIGVFRQGHSKNNQKAGIELQRALPKMPEHRKNIHNLGTTSWSGWRQISLSSAFHNF